MLSMTTSRWLLFLALFVMALVAGCMGTSLRDGADRIAVSNMTHPPFSSWSAEGLPIGIEVELVAQGLSSTGQSVDWVERPFGDLLGLVESGQADIAAATIGITSERAKRVAFTEPYFQTQIVALVRADAKGIQDLDDLKGRSVGVDPGTTAFPVARTALPHSMRVMKPMPDGNWGEMLRAHQIDAMIIDATDLERLQDQAGVPLVALPTALARERFALVVSRDDPELLELLNRAVRAYVAR
jgi:ABC-type amino acid transport substrate-binding protein